MSNRILYVTYDKPRFVMRSGALLRSGFTVSSPRRAEDAIPMVATGDFLAVVIGNSVMSTDRVHVIRGIRKLKPQQPVIYFSDIPGDIDAEADESVDVSADFSKLLVVLHKIEAEGGERAASAAANGK